MHLLNEPAVITAVTDASPRERLLTFLTRNQGGVKLYVKRPPRRISPISCYEPLQGGELVYTRPRSGGHGRLRSFVPQRVWPGIRQHLGRLLQAMAFLETVNLCLTEGESLPEIFALLIDFLNRLEDANRPGLGRMLATLRLLQLSGFAPSLDACVGCRVGVAAGTGVLLSPEGGGIICRACLSARDDATIPVTPGAHGFMMRALTLSAGQARRLRTSEATEREIARLLDSFFEARTGTRPRSGSSIERMGLV